MKVGITGGAGFISGHTIEALIARGHTVEVFDPRGRMDPALMASLSREGREAITLRMGDVRDETAVFELAAHCDALIHLAAVLGTQETIQCPGPSAETNILGSINVFESANRYGLPVVYAGVGNAWMRAVGTGSYTISKTAAEDYTRMFNLYRGGKITVVRPMNAYGPRQSVAAPFGPSKVRKIIPAFVCRALTGAPIEVYGDGTQVSDCVYVKDVASVFAEALEFTAEVGPTANPVEVGPPTSCTVNDVARLVIGAVKDITGMDSSYIVNVPMRPGEVPNAVVSADCSTLDQLQGRWAANRYLPLADGIHRTAQWYAENWLPTWQANNPAMQPA